MNDLGLVLKSIDDIEVLLDEDLSKYSTLKLLAQGNVIIIKSKNALEKVVKALFCEKIDYRILGFGSNQMLKENSDIPYLKLQFPFDQEYLDIMKEEYTLPASVHLSKLSSHASKFCLKGWEVFTGIPATLGGAVFMNAGTGLGEIGPLVKSVKLISKEGVFKTISPDEGSFSYRKNNFVHKGDIIYEVTLIHFGRDDQVSMTIKNYLRKRNETQPLKSQTCGCVFKNSNKELPDGKLATCRAGEFIDIIGLKGFCLDEVRVSPRHANFMENRGNANYSNMIMAIDSIREELKLQFGVDFDTEVKF